MGARAYRECGLMAILSARLVLEHFGVFDDQMKSAFEDIRVTAIEIQHKALADKGFATRFDEGAPAPAPEP